ncbi:spermidine synthase [Desulfonema ishimotonii]|uniref:Polyamine aminopropyltransferase n=1 Tax=Desulfonema ishimotonii TaxID=45657 RepID=A0A401FRL9_9BACT|nr:polyamine aminopropyltransferase [Desulfonema ishimotonii]GBC59605.1 spermidine synthase [Desulfonema ishimotonii]
MSSAGVSEFPGISSVLKIAIFATGCAGIVAEFVLSTLATYLVGNAIFQWTLVMSLMLFAMGLGSRVSRLIRGALLDAFILIEFALSVLCAVSAMLAYSLSAYTGYVDLLIYVLAFVIGSLIGFEIPLVTRINQAYEELRTNISNVMEKDYYGALAGGLIFAFLALPYLGLTYTPILLGAVNFSVAALILWRFFARITRKRVLLAAFAGVLTTLIALGVLAGPVVMYGEQLKYRDKVIFAKQTVYQKIVMTQWQSYYWLFLNGQEQFSTFDEEKYHEPLVHPAMKLSHDISQVLIIGGGDGLAAREVLKYPAVKSVTLVDMDPAMTHLAATHPVLLEINSGSMGDPRLRVINDDAARFVQTDARLYGVIIIDLPDPDSVDMMHVYSEKFYNALRRHLIRGGVLVTQATSPCFSARAFRCLVKTISAAGFAVLPYHNQIPTMGEWGWILGVDRRDMPENRLKEVMLTRNFSDIDTRFMNRDAMISMMHFGKGVLDEALMADVTVNTEINPVLYRYYLSGTWGVY